MLLVAALPVVLIGIGAVGYHLLEGWSLGDALYMTVITVSTVGFKEVGELSPAGRVFTMLLIMGGVSAVFYAGTEIIRTVLEGHLFGDMIRRQRMERSLAELSGHFIICGLGRMGHLVCTEFSSHRLPFVVIERDPALVEEFKVPFGIAVNGDATSDQALRRAGVDRARCLVTVVASDADNLYITMSARLLNENLYIVARSADEGAAEKLKRAGASRVVSPYVIGGHRVAQAVLRPAVVDFIELATRSEHLELQMEEVAIRQGSRLAGRDLKGSQIRQDFGIIIVAIKRADGRMVFNPAPDAILSEGDVLITLGHRQQLDRLELAAQP